MTAIATAAVFLWLGMVLAISFLEAPLKFRAPASTYRPAWPSDDWSSEPSTPPK